MKEKFNPLDDCDSVVIYDTRYYFRCDWIKTEKMLGDKGPALHLSFSIWDDKAKRLLEYEDFKNFGWAAKFRDYIKNTLNGQRAIYWDNTKPKEFN